MRSLSVEELRSLFEYSPDTGAITSSEGRADLLRGDGYHVVRTHGRTYLAHRLAVLLMTGDWPTDIVDHRDLNRGNNVWANLRQATRRQNQQNHATQARNTSGVKGVSWVASRSKWVAQLSIDGRTKNLGRYQTKEEAEAVVRAARETYHGEFANHGSRDERQTDCRHG